MIISEAFDTMPEGWLVYGGGISNWKISQTNKAGGECNELMFYFDPSIIGTSRFASRSKSLDRKSTRLNSSHSV